MRFDLPEHKKLTLEMTIPIRWGDMDAMGHVNNTSYFRYLEIARIEWARSVGCEPDPKGEGIVIVNAFCNFYRQFEYPGDVLLGHDGAQRHAWRDLRRGRRHHRLGRLPGPEVRAPARVAARVDCLTPVIDKEQP
jgi:hypothetical protein